MTRRITTRDGDVIDQIALEAYGRTHGATEAILVANPGLAAQGPILQAGVIVTLPELPTATTIERVRLWD
ncbi:MAG: phage tail protein [Alphaproteobacteria bacterium]|nr:MAG: phage tail protein [Alphaproteobacteria bacterium]